MAGMRYRRKEHQRQSIKLLKKDEGKVVWVLGMFFIQLMIVIMVFEIELFKYRNLSDYIEDAIAASGLASALIDVDRFVYDRVVEISDPVKAYDTYRSALNDNIGSVADEVEIVYFLLYNVDGEMVEVTTVDGTGITNRYIGNLGTTRAPNGEIIRSTGVYSEISFPVEGVFGITTRAQKGKLVEININ
uniref:Uncharacterized protein n=1 Tax=uncultured bacterium fosmid pJB23D10 TaxID=1478061 RepID=A0A0H3UAD4_9BACT|nr:hypothetical protein [uncultured bacterium fosmid pJB23D10]